MSPEALSFVSEETLTPAEFMAWVERQHDDNKYELIGGRVVMNPPSSWPEGEAELRLGHAVLAHVEAHDLGRCFGPSQGFLLPRGAVVAPDFSFVGLARWRAGPQAEAGALLQVVPELVVEIVSPSSGARDGVVKRALYAEAGVLEYWIVDARRREVTVFASAGASSVDAGRTLAEADVLESRAVPGLRVVVRDLLARP